MTHMTQTKSQECSKTSMIAKEDTMTSTILEKNENGNNESQNYKQLEYIEDHKLSIVKESQDDTYISKNHLSSTTQINKEVETFETNEGWLTQTNHRYNLRP